MIYNGVVRENEEYVLNHHTGVGGDSWPQVSTLLGDWTSDSRTLHLTLRVDNDTSVVLEVQVGTVLSSPWSSLSNDDGWHDLLSQLWLTLLDGSHDHVTSGSSWQSVQSSTETLDGKNVKVSGTRVVATVNDGADGQSQLSVSILLCLASMEVAWILRSLMEVSIMYGRLEFH